MARLILTVLLLVLTLDGAGAQTCPEPAGSLDAAEPSVRRGHEKRFVEHLESIGRDLKTETWPAIGLGDSIMQRWPPSLLDEALAERTLNAGVGGDDTRALLWRLEGEPTEVAIEGERVAVGAMDWSRQAPRTVILMIGTNNFARRGGGDGPCDVYWGIRTAVDEARERFPSARIVVVSILPRGKNMLEFDAEIRTTNAALKEAARAPSAGFSFLDAHDAFLCGHRTPCGLVVSPTNVHPTRRGYQVLSDLLRRHVARLPD